MEVGDLRGRAADGAEVVNDIGVVDFEWQPAPMEHAGGGMVAVVCADNLISEEFASHVERSPRSACVRIWSFG